MEFKDFDELEKNMSEEAIKESDKKFKKLFSDSGKLFFYFIHSIS